LNEERIAAWNDEDVDNIPFTNRVCEIVKEARGKTYFSTNVERSSNHFISVNTPTKTYGKGKGMAADLEIYRIMYCDRLLKLLKTIKLLLKIYCQHEQLRPLHFG
jgi:UDPglucose 6-dehydrogenase